MDHWSGRQTRISMGVLAALLLTAAAAPAVGDEQVDWSASKTVTQIEWFKMNLQMDILKDCVKGSQCVKSVLAQNKRSPGRLTVMVVGDGKAAQDEIKRIAQLVMINAGDRPAPWIDFLYNQKVDGKSSANLLRCRPIPFNVSLGMKTVTDFELQDVCDEIQREVYDQQGRRVR